MVEIDGGDDTDLPALLLLQLFRNGLIFFGPGFVHVDGAGIGLVAGSDGGGGGGGVRREGVGVIGHSRASGLKIHKVQILGTVQLSALVVIQAGLRLPVIRILQRAEIIGGGLNLRIAHAVSNK